MRTRVIGPGRQEEALQVLRAGGLIVMPTDTVYGIAAMPLDAGAIDRLYEAKDRPAEKAIPILVAGAEDAARIAVVDATTRRLCDAFWPGALTVVARARASFASPALADDGTIALRMPALNLALALIAAAGGVLAVTSANRSGQPPACSAAEALAQLDGRVDLVLDGGPSPGGIASSVVRAGAQLEILREGALSRSQLETALACEG